MDPAMSSRIWTEGHIIRPYPERYGHSRTRSMASWSQNRASWPYPPGRHGRPRHRPRSDAPDSGRQSPLGGLGAASGPWGRPRKAAPGGPAKAETGHSTTDGIITIICPNRPRGHPAAMAVVQRTCGVRVRRRRRPRSRVLDFLGDHASEKPSRTVSRPASTTRIGLGSLCQCAASRIAAS